MFLQHFISMFLQHLISMFLQHFISMFLQNFISMFLRHFISMFLQHFISMFLRHFISMFLQHFISMFLQHLISMFLQHFISMFINLLTKRRYWIPSTKTEYSVKFRCAALCVRLSVWFAVLLIWTRNICRNDTKMLLAAYPKGQVSFTSITRCNVPKSL